MDAVASSMSVYVMTSSLVSEEFLKELQGLVQQMHIIGQNENICSENKLLQISELKFNTKIGSVALEDLVLTFSYLPSSKTTVSIRRI